MTGPRPGTAERAEVMRAMYRSGMTLKAIGDHFGVSRQYVHTHVGDIARTEAGASLVAARKAAEKAAKAEARCRAKWGVSLAEYKTLLAARLTRPYIQQKLNAAARGIPFRLTLGEWHAIWRDSGKLHLRGLGVGKFCMSRRGDLGAYEVGNVFIQSCVQNSREGFARPSHKDAVGVYCIYPGKAKPYLAKYGDTRLGFYATVEAAAAARAAHLAAQQVSA